MLLTILRLAPTTTGKWPLIELDFNRKPQKTEELRQLPSATVKSQKVLGFVYQNTFLSVLFIFEIYRKYNLILMTRHRTNEILEVNKNITRCNSVKGRSVINYTKMCKSLYVIFRKHFKVFNV
ncbi:hypothetical protein ACFFRR_009615 [Megaselia abdita]